MDHGTFHLHLISDATGETLIAVSRAVVAQYEGVSSIEHLYPMVRSEAHLERAIAEIKAAPGMVLFTLVDQVLARRLEVACQAIGAPCLSVLQPILDFFRPISARRPIHGPARSTCSTPTISTASKP